MQTRSTEPLVQKVYALGLTYADHARETHQLNQGTGVFLKACSSEVAPERFVMPTSAQMMDALQQLDPELAAWLGRYGFKLPVLLDYEVELGMRLLENCTLEDINNQHEPVPIAYFIANDLTARGLQICGHKMANPLSYWSAAKSMSGMLPMGDLELEGSSRMWPDINLTTRINGQLRQNARTSQLIYSPSQVLSQVMRQLPEQRLHRGDLILTGTPAGVAMQITPWQYRLGQALPRRWAILLALKKALRNPKFLQSGDRLEFAGGKLGRVSLLIEAAHETSTYE